MVGDHSEADEKEVRLLAYFMMDCAQGFAGGKMGNVVRLLKVGMKVGRVCLGAFGPWIWRGGC